VEFLEQQFPCFIRGKFPVALALKTALELCWCEGVHALNASQSRSRSLWTLGQKVPCRVLVWRLLGWNVQKSAGV